MIVNYFRLQYSPDPDGVYKETHAIVYLTPDSPACIPIRDLVNRNETIAEDLLYLLVYTHILQPSD